MKEDKRIEAELRALNMLDYLAKRENNDDLSEKIRATAKDLRNALMGRE